MEYKISRGVINQKGQVALLIVMIIMLLLLFVSLFLANLIIKQTKITSNIHKSIQAYYLADTGTEMLLYKINAGTIKPGDFDTPSNLLSGSIGGLGSFKADKVNDSPLEIKISGIYKEASRAVELSWE
jgi:hypothetical protein